MVLEMNKPKYRQSNIVNYFTCPRKFYLSTKYDMKVSTAMGDGRLFEAMVFGPKPGETMEELVGRRREKTLQSYEAQVGKIRELFVSGESYVQYEYESENWILTGEADFVGDVMIVGKKVRAIADLKFTGSIMRIWDEKNSRADFLQSAVYPYLHWKKYNEILPFVYFVVEKITDIPPDTDPIIRKYLIHPDEDTFEWVEREIDRINDDMEFSPETSRCFEGAFGSRCPYLLFCDAGRKLIETTVQIDFSEVPEYSI